MFKIGLSNIYGYGSDINNTLAHKPKPVMEVGIKTSKEAMGLEKYEEDIYTMIIDKIIKSLDAVKSDPNKLNQFINIMPLEVRDIGINDIEVKLRLFA